MLLTQNPKAYYRVARSRGVHLRVSPFFEAPCTGPVLLCNEIFGVSEELPGADGRVYLRLADGRGWAYDDSSLFPHDPSVARGRWEPVGPCINYAPMPSEMVPWEMMGEAMMPLDATKKRRRRKRGGVKRNKNKNKADGAPNSSCGSEAEADTEAPSSSDYCVQEDAHSEAETLESEAHETAQVLRPR